MSGEENVRGMLSSYRILDLTNERGFICGKVLADLGADVIKIEKPGGDPARSIGPFYHDIPDPEKSLYWFAFNTNKRGITLDIETADGQEIFKRLIKNADIVIESFDPGYMDKLGLGYSTLSQVNPRMIMTSITGFGQTGPYKDYKAPDIVVWALSGNAYMTGDPDRAPVMSSFPFSYIVAGALQAAVGTMVALNHREMIGEGQHVDASTQVSLTWPVSCEPPGMWIEDGTIMKRMGRVWRRPQVVAGRKTVWVGAPMIYQCKDGDINFAIMAGLSYGTSTNALSKWVESEGMASETTKGIDWTKVEWSTVSQEVVDEVVKDFSRFFMTRTKAELYEGASQRGVMLYPVLTPKDMLELSQLKFRDYWVEVDHPELGTSITYHGPFLKTSETFDRVYRRAPLMGEHNEDVYIRELGMSKEELLTLKQMKVI
jgi:crotonobetainyl-CoA:carnitine CoA-transferase CaiB-like acyl-CoA transferase